MQPLSATQSSPSGHTSDFAARIVAWQRSAGRNHLPWQGTRDPYRIWVSEIMLQQTQVSTVIPYFERFMQRFPTVEALAQAEESDVLSLWSGLGYYARGRNLHRAARMVRDLHGGRFPREFDAVVALPGVGRSTAGAICAFAYGQRRAILDGNVKRVLTRAFGIAGYPGEPAVATQLWSLSESLLPAQDIEPYTQGLMDLGAGICARSRPLCDACPLVDQCVAHREQRVADLPTPRTRLALPQRRTRMLILWTGSAVLLERRPSPGIWGGLWCFPEVQDDETQRALLVRFGAGVDAEQSLPELKHGFTHYRLTIEPRLLRISGPANRVQEDSDMCWMRPDQARAAALPAPVRVLLDWVENSAAAARQARCEDSPSTT